MSWIKINPKTTTKTSAIIDKIGISTLKTEREKQADIKFQERFRSSQKIVDALGKHGVHLTREHWVAVSLLTEETEEIIRFKDHLFLPSAASKIRGNEARHLTCWSSIATGDKLQHINIRSEWNNYKKQGIEIPGTFGTFEQQLRYCVFTSGIRCDESPEKFSIKVKQLHQKIKKFNKQPGVKVQFWSIEFTILDHGGQFKFNIHANVIYTLKRANIKGFRENIKRNVTPNEHWEDSGIITPDGIGKVAKYVNKTTVKKNNNKEEDESNNDDVNDNESTDSKGFNHDIDSTKHDGYFESDEINVGDIKQEHSLDGELIDLVDLAERDDEVLYKLYKSTHRLKMAGAMNEYKQFKNFLKSWGVRVVYASDRLRGLEFQFKQITAKITVEEHERRRQAEVEKKLAKRNKRIERNNYLKASVQEVKDEEENALKFVKRRASNLIKEIGAEKKRVLKRISDEGKKHPEKAAEYDAKYKSETACYNGILNSIKDSKKFDVHYTEQRFKAQQLSVKDSIKAQYKQEDEEEKAAKKKESKGTGRNVLMTITDVRKNEKIGAYDAYLWIAKYDKNALDKPETDSEVERFLQVLEIKDKWQKHAEANGWSPQLKRNVFNIDIDSSMFLEGCWSNYLVVNRGLYRKTHLQEDLDKWVSIHYDPTDWDKQNVPEIKDSNVLLLIEELCEKHDSGVRNAVITGFMNSRLTEKLLISYTTAENWEKSRLLEDTGYFNFYPKNIIPDESLPEQKAYPPDFRIETERFIENNPDLQMDMRY